KAMKTARARNKCDFATDGSSAAQPPSMADQMITRAKYAVFAKTYSGRVWAATERKGRAKTSKTLFACFE
ncbi:MAG: hypothetical protein QGG25_00355, partial [Phycisphaerae bacterium]|nr:hypothetical protein [Phycisphaerae bacterium]